MILPKQVKYYINHYTLYFYFSMICVLNLNPTKITWDIWYRLNLWVSWNFSHHQKRNKTQAKIEKYSFVSTLEIWGMWYPQVSRVLESELLWSSSVPQNAQRAFTLDQFWAGVSSVFTPQPHLYTACSAVIMAPLTSCAYVCSSDSQFLLISTLVSAGRRTHVEDYREGPKEAAGLSICRTNSLQRRGKACCTFCGKFSEVNLSGPEY